LVYNTIPLQQFKSQFILLMRGGSNALHEQNELEAQEHIERWGAYMAQLHEGQHLLGGRPLRSSGRVITKNGTTNGLVEALNGSTVSGWLQIQANDYNQAVALCKDCPIFEYNGDIEIREVMPMNL